MAYSNWRHDRYGQRMTGSSFSFDHLSAGSVLFSSESFTSSDPFLAEEIIPTSLEHRLES